MAAQLPAISLDWTEVLKEKQPFLEAHIEEASVALQQHNTAQFSKRYILELRMNRMSSIVEGLLALVTFIQQHKLDSCNTPKTAMACCSTHNVAADSTLSTCVHSSEVILRNHAAMLQCILFCASDHDFCFELGSLGGHILLNKQLAACADCDLAIAEQEQVNYSANSAPHANYAAGKQSPIRSAVIISLLRDISDLTEEIVAAIIATRCVFPMRKDFNLASHDCNSSSSSSSGSGNNNPSVGTPLSVVGLRLRRCECQHYHHHHHHYLPVSASHLQSIGQNAKRNGTGISTAAAASASSPVDDDDNNNNDSKHNNDDDNNAVAAVAAAAAASHARAVCSCPSTSVFLRQTSMHGLGQRGVGLQLWPAAIILSRFMILWMEAEQANFLLCTATSTPTAGIEQSAAKASLKDKFAWSLLRNKRVLEVGAGNGLCGITAARYASAVTLSDFTDEILSNLRYNIEINTGKPDINSEKAFLDVETEKEKEGHRSCRINVCKADWNNFPSNPIALAGTGDMGRTKATECVTSCIDKYDLLIGSDIVCDEDEADGVLRTLQYYMGEKTRALFVLPSGYHRYGVHRFLQLLNDAKSEFHFSMRHLKSKQCRHEVASQYHGTPVPFPATTSTSTNRINTCTSSLCYSSSDRSTSTSSCGCCNTNSVAGDIIVDALLRSWFDTAAAARKPFVSAAPLTDDNDDNNNNDNADTSAQRAPKGTICSSTTVFDESLLFAGIDEAKIFVWVMILIWRK